MPEPLQYQAKALELVAIDINTKLDEGYDSSPFNPAGVYANDLYVVWFSKTLQNWKALVSTDLVPGQYFEVTYNGNTHESYVDWYQKQTNTAISDQDYQSSEYLPAIRRA